MIRWFMFYFVNITEECADHSERDVCICMQKNRHQKEEVIASFAVCIIETVYILSCTVVYNKKNAFAVSIKGFMYCGSLK